LKYINNIVFGILYAYYFIREERGAVKEASNMSKIHVFLIVTLSFITQFSYAGLIGIDQVDGVNSLYSDDWGHPYNTGANNEYNAIGRGNHARAFEVSGNPYGFNSGANLRITATGCTVDLDATTCTGPDYLGGPFRDLPVYSLIGVWSTDANLIMPVDLVSVNPAFLISGLLELVVPTFTNPLYLFMATNDGGFSDNSGAYDVRIEQVPVPSVLLLMLAGLGLGFCRRKAIR